MKLLILSALKNRKHYVLFVITLVAMLFLTLATQMEVCALGVITNKGQDFFELFAPVKDGVLDKQDHVSRELLESRWQELDPEGKGSISQADSIQFLAKRKRSGMIDRLVSFLDHYIGISGNLRHLAFVLIVIALFKAVSLFIQRYTTRLIAIRVSRDLRQTFFEHIQSLHISFYQKYNIGSLSTRAVTDALIIAEAINAALLNYLQTPFTVVTTLTLCFLTSWQLSLIVFCGFPLIILPIVIIAKRVKRISKQIQRRQETFASVLIDFLSGIQTVKIFAMEKFSMKKYQEHNHRMAALEQKGARYDLSSRPIVHTIGMFFLATSLLYGLYVLQMGVSDVLIYCGFLYIFYEPVKKFAEQNNTIQKGVAASERMFEVLDIKPQIQDHDGAIEFQEFNDQIEFDDVWFKYNDEWVLKGVSFTIKKGEFVALVGPTGAGKSTIVQLLPRLYEPNKGEIRIDGKPLSDYTQKSLRENIAFVPQKSFLFLDTIAENIAFGRDFSDEKIQDAAKRAHAHEFIRELPLQYDTLLKDAGANLSGGQQQRLSIARALLKNAPILVLDEATSALDVVSEQKIKMALHEMRGRASQILIAHRLSTIEDADKIIYLEKGCKVAEGTREELLRSCDGFKLMWETMHKQERK